MLTEACISSVGGHQGPFLHTGKRVGRGREGRNFARVVKNAYIKVKSLENLHDKQKEQYLKEFQKEEIKEIDDIVNSRRNIA